MKRVPGYDGGAMVPTGPDGRIPGLGGGDGCRTSIAVPAPVSPAAISRPINRRRTAQPAPKGYPMSLPVPSWPTCPARACGTLATSIGIGRIIR